MKRYFILLSGVLLASLFLSCSATNRLTMGITEPAPVTLSADARKIGIINRSMPSESNKHVDKIDQILSAEGKMLDKEGAEATLIALSEVLHEYGTYDEMKILEVEEIKSVPYVPMSHPFMERFIGTIRREYLDNVPFWNSLELERKPGEFKY